MKFDKALELLLQGKKMKLPTWGGYWYWNAEKETIMMHLRDGREMDIRDTKDVEYTMKNIAHDDWEIADEENCPQLGGTATFGFGDAIRMMKRGLKVARKGWNGKGMWIVLMPSLYLPPYNTGDTARKVNDRTAKHIGEDKPLDSQPYFSMWTAQGKWQPGWLASQPDMLAEDWYIVE